jgi:hypothetical protein
MQLEAARRMYAKRHEDKPFHDGSFTIWSEKPSKLCPFHYSDGVTIWLSREDLTPDDDFLGNTPSGLPGLPDAAGEGE